MAGSDAHQHVTSDGRLADTRRAFERLGLWNSDTGVRNGNTAPRFTLVVTVHGWAYPAALNGDATGNRIGCQTGVLERSVGRPEAFSVRAGLAGLRAHCRKQAFSQVLVELPTNLDAAFSVLVQHEDGAVLAAFTEQGVGF